VKTDSPVVITQAPKTVIHATGMVFDKKKQTLTLNKRVKAHYERPTGIAPKITKTKPVATKPQVLKPTAAPLSALSAISAKKVVAAKPKVIIKKSSPTKKSLKKRKTLKKATRSKK
jgi:lipopolysaccharide export system protein LptC